MSGRFNNSRTSDSVVAAELTIVSQRLVFHSVRTTFPMAFRDSAFSIESDHRGIETAVIVP